MIFEVLKGDVWGPVNDSVIVKPNQFIMLEYRNYPQTPAQPLRSISKHLTI